MMATWDLMNTYPADYKLIFVGDATMSPYEITYPGGSVEHWNEEPGSDWMQRILDIYSRAIWLNPVPEKYWNGTASPSARAPTYGRAHVSADPRRPRPCHARTQPVNRTLQSRAVS